MGLFDSNNKKKKRDDFDSPVERIDLSASAAPAAEPEAEPSADSVDAAPPAAAAPAPDAAPAPARGDYGIEEAIALMRTLPAENVELVVRVVKHTLESTRIDIKSIIEDASAKQSRIEQRISVLRDEITDLEKEIETRKSEIGTLEADHKETTQVKERLLLAEKLGKGDPAAARSIASAAKSGPLGKPNEGSRRTRSPSTSPPPAPGSTSKTTIVPKK